MITKNSNLELAYCRNCGKKPLVACYNEKGKLKLVCVNCERKYSTGSLIGRRK
jgi:hypothetical protein